MDFTSNQSGGIVTLNLYYISDKNAEWELFDWRALIRSCINSKRLNLYNSNLLNQNLQNVKTPKSKLGSFVQRYPFKFPALTSNVSVHIMVRGLCTQLTIHPGFLTKDEALETTPRNFYGIYSYSYRWNHWNQSWKQVLSKLLI